MGETLPTARLQELTFCRWAAITRGAVLHKLGLKYVNERVLRRHYGIVSTVPFEENVHPQSLKITDLDGKIKCANVMDWFAKKVKSYLKCAKGKGDKVLDGKTVRRSFFTVRNDASYRKPKVEHGVSLYACQNDVAPTYNDGSGFVS